MNSSKRAQKIKKLSGFTIIELLLYLGLLSLVLLVVVDLLLNLGEFDLKSKAQSNVQREASFITTRLNFDIHRASSINLPLASGNSGNSLSLQIGSETLIYSLNGTDLEISEVQSGRTAKLNSNLTKITSLNFLRLGSSLSKPSLKFNFEIGNLNPTKQGEVTKIYEATVGTR